MAEDQESREILPLSGAVTHILGECRMVLPGIQALFGFQLIAVFNDGFSQKLLPLEQRIHLAAIALVAISAALVMAPAALHRQTGPREASAGFVATASRLLLLSMAPLLVGIVLDFFLIARIILLSYAESLAVALALAAVLGTLWFALPHLKSFHRADRRSP